MTDKQSFATDSSLRAGRVVFYKRHIAALDRVMEEFLHKAGARSAYLIDKDGHLITSSGEDGDFDSDTISALVAGAFAATKEMARLLGEREFSAMFHQGQRDNIQLSLVGDRAILTILFDDSTTLGMVRLYTSEAVERLEEVFEQSVLDSGEEDQEQLAPEYGESAKETLDSLFDPDTGD